MRKGGFAVGEGLCRARSLQAARDVVRGAELAKMAEIMTITSAELYFMFQSIWLIMP